MSTQELMEITVKAQHYVDIGINGNYCQGTKSLDWEITHTSINVAFSSQVSLYSYTGVLISP
jgi:hypothetical protein